MIKCTFCHFKNLNGTTFCQRCGKRLRKKRFISATQGGAIASMANPQMGLATFVGMQIDQNAARPQRRRARVDPMEDGQWFCPDCGHLNRKFDLSCISCGREFS